MYLQKHKVSPKALVNGPALLTPVTNNCHFRQQRSHHDTSLSVNYNSIRHMQSVVKLYYFETVFAEDESTKLFS